VTDKKKADVSTPSSAHERMTPRWALIDTLLGGTEALRAAGRDRLPQHEKESDKNYKNRLERATLLNAFEDTLEKLTGKPFGEDIILSEDMPEAIVALCEDVDMQGTALQPFCRRWFREGWAKGFSHVLVDMPVPQTVFDGEGKPRPRTLEDDRVEGARPYWVQIRPENVLAAYGEVVQGRTVLTHVRILETTIEREGFEEVVTERIKVLEPGTWELWKFNTSAKQWEVEDYGPTGLTEIPLRTFYAAERVGIMECKPPLTDLAHLNIAHWQSSADQRNVLTVARFPILAASGLEEGAKVDIGPNNFLSTTDPSGKWYYVEHTGAAIEAGRKDLEDLENQMASYGSEFLRKRPGTETATAAAIDSAESSSYLGATAQTFQDCVEEVLALTAKWMSLDRGGSIKLASIDEDPAGADTPELDALQKARAGRDLSRPAYLSELKRRGVLADDFDPVKDAELIANEPPTDGLGKMFGQGND
jgi:hypothetical protein